MAEKKEANKAGVVWAFEDSNVTERRFVYGEEHYCNSWDYCLDG